MNDNDNGLYFKRYQINYFNSNEQKSRGERKTSTQRKSSWRRVETQQTQSTCDAETGNQTWATLVRGNALTTMPALGLVSQNS